MFRHAPRSVPFLRSAPFPPAEPVGARQDAGTAPPSNFVLCGFEVSLCRLFAGLLRTIQEHPAHVLRLVRGEDQANLLVS